MTSKSLITDEIRRK